MVRRPPSAELKCVPSLATLGRELRQASHCKESSTNTSGMLLVLLTKCKSCGWLSLVTDAGKLCYSNLQTVHLYVPFLLAV